MKSLVSVDPNGRGQIIKDLTAVAATAAVAQMAADSDEFWIVDSITFSYSDTPASGKLTVDWGGTSYLEVDITTGGEKQLIFDPPLYPSDSKDVALTITLASGGGTVVGKVSARIR